MLTPEELRQIRRLSLQAGRRVDGLFAGGYRSAFRGRGMEFEEVRPYVPGDDVRHIDWNVTARAGGKPFVKVYDEERELTVVLMVDASASGAFGSDQRLKGEVAVEISAVLAFSAIKNNDRVGLLIFTDEVEVFVPPKKGKRHVLRVIRELLYHEPRGQRESLRDNRKINALDSASEREEPKNHSRQTRNGKCQDERHRQGVERFPEQRQLFDAIPDHKIRYTINKNTYKSSS